jgi:Uma2 family endonuclease
VCGIGPSLGDLKGEAMAVQAPVQAQRKLFTTAEYHQMIQTGVFDEDDRLELVEGEVTEMSPISSNHAGGVNRLSELLRERLKGRALVSVQNPVHLSEYSEPQPDLALLRPRADYYAGSHPTPDDALLVVEIAETSAGLDRNVKMPMYARAGIAEAWLVSLADGWIEVYREPSSVGYLLTRRVLSGATLSLQAFPDDELAVSDLV